MPAEALASIAPPKAKPFAGPRGSPSALWQRNTESLEWRGHKLVLDSLLPHRVHCNHSTHKTTLHHSLFLRLILTSPSSCFEMSDPYNQYPPNYSSPAPGAQGYPAPGQQYDQHQGYQQHSEGYGQPGYDQHNYPQQQPHYGDAPAGFGPPQRVDSYGPPQAGGFQHGQEGNQYGAYDASNPQGHAGY